MATILEALQNARYNLHILGKVGMSLLPIVKEQLNNATTLLEKGYDLDDDVEEILDEYEDLDSVPNKN